MLINFRKSVSNIYIRFSETLLLILLSSVIANGQKDNIIIGIFRNIDIDERVATYVEFKNDFTVMLKRLSFENSSGTKSVVTHSGTWRTIRDTLILNFPPYYKTTQDSIPVQLKFLIKNENVLYTRRLNTGKFVKDGLLGRKVQGRLVRLSTKLLEEYTDLK
jgi:hypothetical protein